MAKVKIQAGTNSEEDLPTPGTASTKKAKKEGAVALLTRILKERGFAGWYQVCVNGTNDSRIEAHEINSRE